MGGGLGRKKELGEKRGVTSYILGGDRGFTGPRFTKYISGEIPGYGAVPTGAPCHHGFC